MRDLKRRDLDPCFLGGPCIQEEKGSITKNDFDKNVLCTASGKICKIAWNDEILKKNDFHDDEKISQKIRREMRTDLYKFEVEETLVVEVSRFLFDYLWQQVGYKYCYLLAPNMLIPLTMSHFDKMVESLSGSYSGEKYEDKKLYESEKDEKNFYYDVHNKNHTIGKKWPEIYEYYASLLPEFLLHYLKSSVFSGNVVCTHDSETSNMVVDLLTTNLQMRAALRLDEKEQKKNSKNSKDELSKNDQEQEDISESLKINRNFVDRWLLHAEAKLERSENEYFGSIFPNAYYKEVLRTKTWKKVHNYVEVNSTPEQIELAELLAFLPDERETRFDVVGNGTKFRRTARIEAVPANYFMNKRPLETRCQANRGQNNLYYGVLK